MGRLPTREELKKIAKPILFNTEMTKAIMEGRKSQTRRVVKNFPNMDTESIDNLNNRLKDNDIQELKKLGNLKPKDKVGDILWVREPAKVIHYSEAGNYGGSWVDDYAHVQYLADNEVYYHWDEFPEDPKSWLWECKGIPNGCCKSLARTFIKNTGVRVERLQDITIDDIYQEGIDPFDVAEMLDGTEFKEFVVFENLWNSTAPKSYKWEDNPFVFVYEFERVEYD